MRELTYLEAVGEAQIEEMRRDERMLMMGQDLRASLYGGSGLVQMFGSERVRDLPTSETASVGAAVGAAMTGLRPLVDMTMASFCFVAWDQFTSQVAKARYVTGGRVAVPVTYRVALVFDAGVGVQHSDRVHPMFMQIPGLKVVAPTTPADAKALLKASIRDEDPVVFIEDAYLWSTKGPVGGADDLLEIGTAEVKREGGDVTLVAIGRGVPFALAAAEELAAEGISVEVVDPRTLVPFDWPTVFGSVEKTGRLVAVDFASRTCSAASEIVATVCEERHDALRSAARRVTAPDVHAPFNAALEKRLYPNTAKIAAAVRATVESR